MKKFKVQLM